MSTDSTMTRALRRLGNDNPRERQAAQFEIFDRYFQRLIQAATGKLNWRIRRRHSGSDVAICALKSFFLRFDNGMIIASCRSELERILYTIMLNKVRDAVRYHYAQKRDVRNEHSYDHTLSESQNELNLILAHMQTKEPTHKEVLNVLHFIEALPEELGKMLQLRLDGYSIQEIADHLGCTRETIRLRFERISRIAQRWSTDDD